MDDDFSGGYILIDPPVSLYSPKEEIQEWIKELRLMPDKPEVREAIKEAESWLKD
jgi:hypothetical protein